MRTGSARDSGRHSPSQLGGGRERVRSVRAGQAGWYRGATTPRPWEGAGRSRSRGPARADEKGRRKAMGTYRPVDPRADLPAMEREVLDFWGRARIFEKSLALREGAPEWVFYEGPPTANGKPGLHHVEARTFKD